MQYELIVRPDADAVAREGADRFVQLAAEAVAAQGRFRVALSGGGTPGRLYRLLADEPYRSRVPWPSTHIYWGDERHLPPGDPGRNDTEVLQLLAEAGVPAENVHPVPFVPGDLPTAAAEYEAILRRQARAGEPLLDLLLLGLGTDGHTASLFPGTAALAERSRLVVANRAVYEDRFPERVTLTLPAVNAAAVVVFLVTGASKRQVLAQVLGEPLDPPLPAQLVHPTAGRLIWLADEKAVR